VDYFSSSGVNLSSMAEILIYLQPHLLSSIAHTCPRRPTRGYLHAAMTSSPTTRLHQELKPVHCNQLEDTYMHLVFHTLPQDCIMSSNPVHGHQLEALLRIFGPTDDEAFADNDYQSICVRILYFFKLNANIFLKNAW